MRFTERSPRGVPQNARLEAFHGTPLRLTFQISPLWSVIDIVGRAMAAFGNHTHGLFGYWPAANTPKKLFFFAIRLTAELLAPRAARAP